jgi:enoyl-CoA hydratase/carnithine racemase
MSDKDFLTIARTDGVTTLTMDDGKANVMSVRMLQALHSAFEQAQGDIVVIVGRPGLFSGGFDLAVFQRDPRELVTMLSEGARLTERVLSHPRPVVAVCTGHAIAMGAFLLLSADWRLGVDDASRVIQANEVQNAMTLPRFAIEVCRQRLTPAALVRTALLSEPHAPHQALRAGFLDEIAAPDQLMQAAHARIERLRKLDTQAFTATQQRLRAPLLSALHQAIEQDIAEWRSRFAAGA